MKLRWVFGLTVSACLAAPIVAQNGTTTAPNVNQPHDGSLAATPGSANSTTACPRFENKERNVSAAIQARVTETMDSSHLKPGDPLVAKVLFGINYPSCSLVPGAMLYGHVTAANSSSNPRSSELGLVFDHVDCKGGEKQELAMRLIALVAPPGQAEMEHEVLPSEVRGGVRQLPVTSSDGIDDNLNPAQYPRIVHPGLLVRMPNARLDPEGAPGCSALIRSSDRKLRVAQDTELILTPERVTKAAASIQ